MASIVELSKLLQAIAVSDVAGATAQAHAIISGFERRGQHSAAMRLKSALSANGNVRPIQQGYSWAGFQLSGALSRLPTDTEFSSVALRTEARRTLEELIAEWKCKEKLRKHSLEHRSRLIFSGPPGCGKTFTARAMARELGIPCYLVRFDALIGAFLGETATHLREVFRFAERTPSVLLLDEIDAIGKRRGDPMDVGELDLAGSFYSIQSLHAPLRSVAAAKVGHRGAERQHVPASRRNIEPTQLPCVAVIDTGVPDEHRLLAPYRRQRYLDPDSAGRALGHHGSRVASRIVFGDVDYSDGLPIDYPEGDCSFFDATVCVTDRDIEDKAVIRAMDTVVRVAPDVRVFNLSFDSVTPLAGVGEVQRRERLLLAQDLDNFIFANDVLVVVAAGNTPEGITPVTAYPGHHNDPQWSLGAWARAFNALTCGATVERLTGGGMVTHVGWPSPFSRVGPGTCDTPKPDYAAHGGDFTPEYRFAPGLGVWACNADGRWEDSSGTSLAAPILARHAAKAFEHLARACEGGARPYAATVKAFLALTATPPSVEESAAELANRALGRGSASSVRLAKPIPTSAVFLWQGVLEGPKNLARVQVPVPLDWLDDAELPRLRLVVSWDSPVNAAAEDVWACRHLSAQLRMAPDGTALKSSRSAHKSYTTSDRTFDLTALPDGETPTEDLWLVELSYDQLAEYSTAIEFSLQQRVAFAIELYDAADDPVSPQGAVQALPIEPTLNRLSVPGATLRTPYLIKTRV